MTDLYLNGVRHRPVKGIEHYLVSENGDVYSRRYHRILKGIVSRSGYKRVDLLCNGEQKWLLIHRLVATTFIDNPDNKPQVNHKDGDKTNNRVGNLEWTTHKENMAHASNSGLMCCGEAHPPSKLTELEVREIKGLNRSLSQREIASSFNVTQTTISKILRNKHWKHVI